MLDLLMLGGSAFQVPKSNYFPRPPSKPLKEEALEDVAGADEVAVEEDESPAAET